jgi:hypothetical protein
MRSPIARNESVNRLNIAPISPFLPLPTHLATDGSPVQPPSAL